MNLKQGTLLKHGEYRIERELGHGGFGITYLATQVGLNRKVAIKEFFMSGYCERDADTSQVTVGSEGSKELVEKFRKKFIKEAQTIAEMDNHHIIRIHDVFEDNGTAYYVMEYLPGGDLRSRIPSGGMPEVEAVGYIREVADALRYIHSKNILHLDIKPTNILFRGSGEAVLIDFGISKHYDDEGGSQTSSTPVGISERYAPTEQYEREGVSSFAASTDIYSLGATLYCLLSGSRPPKASIVLNEGLPELPSRVSAATRTAVEQAMQPRRKDRPQSVDAFLALLAAEVDESTHLDDDSYPLRPSGSSPLKRESAAIAEEVNNEAEQTPIWKKLLLPALACIVIVLAVVLWPKGGDTPIKEEPAAPTTTPLYVTTTPSGAAVYIDGKKVGTTPIEDKEVARGSHKVKLSKEGYEDKTLTRTFGDKPVVINETLAEKPKPQSQIMAQQSHPINTGQSTLETKIQEEQNRNDMIANSAAQESVAMRRDIFFAIDNDKINLSEEVKVKEIAVFLKQNPNTIVEVTGYADRSTGTPRINAKHAFERATAVESALVAEGIPLSRIRTLSMGDKVQPYEEPILNRVVVCIVK